MDTVTYVAVCTNVYSTSIEWARVFTGKSDEALEKAKSFVSEDWKKTLEEFKINPADYDDNSIYDVEQHGDMYSAYLYDGNDVEYSWEIVRAETDEGTLAKASAPEEEPTVEVFIWNGMVDAVKTNDPDLNVRVVVHNSNNNYSDEDVYEDAKGALPYMVDWDTDDFVTDLEE